MIRELRWKFILVVALLAMAVSLLAGGIAGVRMGPMVLRALLGTVIFAILATGINILGLRFFPELFEMTGSEKESSDEVSFAEERTGQHINILSPDDEELAIDPSAGADFDASEGLNAVSGASGDPDLDLKTKSMDNIEEFSSDFSDDRENDEERFSGESANDETSGAMDGKDPEDYAKAIHTVLKRDEKG